MRDYYKILKESGELAEKSTVDELTEQLEDAAILKLTIRWAINEKTRTRKRRIDEVEKLKIVEL